MSSDQELDLDQDFLETDSEFSAKSGNLYEENSAFSDVQINTSVAEATRMYKLRILLKFKSFFADLFFIFNYFQQSFRLKAEKEQ